jgi:hypothetical protein
MAKLIARIRSALAFILGDFCLWVIRPETMPKRRDPLPEGFKPSLRRAFARVSRAEEHLAQLVRKVAERGQGYINAISFHPDHNSPNHLMAKAPPLLVDDSMGVLIGEIAHNLRSALDNLVFELAALDSGYIIEGTQFPIESKKNRFRWRVNGGWLNGLNATHVTAIERLQPYRGCEWTAALNSIANIDKHMTIIPRQTEFNLTVHSVDKDHIPDFADMPGAIHSAITADGTEVYVKAVLSSSIQFLDGTPIIETLEVIKSEVARAFEAFKPDFERAAGATHNTTPSP